MENRCLSRTGYFLVTWLIAFIALGLMLGRLSWRPATVQAAPRQQNGDLFLRLPIEKTATRASVYMITNPGSTMISTTHEFYEVDVIFEVENFVYSFTDQLAPFETKSYDLSTFSAIPDGVVDEVQITATGPISGQSDICQPTIQSVTEGDWRDPATWDLNRLPTSSDIVMITPRHFIFGGPKSELRGLCNFGIIDGLSNAPLRLEATEFISNYGTIRSADGQIGTRQAMDCGGNGQTLGLYVFGGPILNTGRLWAGGGGGSYRCPGQGGKMLVYGRNVTNEGEICGGTGGDTFDTIDGLGLEVIGRTGGITIIYGKWGGPGFIRNTGLLCGGDGGSADVIAETSHHGGPGGNLKIISLPNVFLSGGSHRAGRGGTGAAGGDNGSAGTVFIEPNTISLSGSSTSLAGGHLQIFGGNDWLLDLSNMNGAAISATGNITLAVGSGGIIDLRGNTDQIMQADGQILIAADVISMDGGMSLTDLVGSNVTTTSSQLLYDVSLTGPDQAEIPAGQASNINLTLLNGGPMTDSYVLSWADSAGWPLSILPPTRTVAGLDIQEMAIQVVPPGSVISGTTNQISVTAVSLTDPQVMAFETLEVTTIAGSGQTIYLPLVTK